MIFIPLYYYLDIHNAPKGLNHVCYDLTHLRKWFLSESRMDDDIYKNMSLLTEIDIVPTSAKETVPKIMEAVKKYIGKIQREREGFPRCVNIHNLLATDPKEFESGSEILTHGLLVDGTTVYEAGINTLVDDPTQLDQRRVTVSPIISNRTQLKKRVARKPKYSSEIVYNVFDWHVVYEPLKNTGATHHTFGLHSTLRDRAERLTSHRIGPISIYYAAVYPADFSRKRWCKTLVRKTVHANVEPSGTMWASEHHAVIPLDDYLGRNAFTGCCTAMRVGILPESLRNAVGTQQTAQNIIDWILEHGLGV